MPSLPASDAELTGSSPWWYRRAGWLYGALAAGELPDHDGAVEKRRLPISLDSLGSLPVEDGRLVVADPYLMDNPQPVVQLFRNTPYEVVIARPTVGPDHLRVAAALLVAGTRTGVSTWAMAHWQGQDVAALGPEEFLGYGVDAGTGCFASASAAQTAARVLAADAGMLDDPLSRALFADTAGAGGAIAAPEEGATPIALFSSGWGDGLYPTWLGLDAAGEVSVSITDFLLTGDPYAAAEKPSESPRADEQQPPRQSRWKRRLFRPTR